MKYDPKLLKKIDGTQLIAVAKEVSIKNAEKVSKEQLIPAYLEAVEKMDQTTLTATMVDMYNKIVTILELDKNPDENPDEILALETVEEVPASEVTVEEPVVIPTPQPTPKLNPRIPKPTPSAVPKPPIPSPASASAQVKPTPAPKEKKAPPPRKDTFSRWMALGEALKEIPTGTIDGVIDRSNVIYQEHGGKDNVREATTIAKVSLVMLSSMGKAKVTDKDYTLVK